MIPNLGQGGAEKVLVNLVNNMDKTKFDITVKTLFDIGVNKKYLDEIIKYDSCFKKTFRANSQVLKLFSPKFLYKKLIREEYDIVVSFLEGPTARIISGCSSPKTKKICWIHVEQCNRRTASYSFRNFKEAKRCYSKYEKIVSVSHSVKEDFQKIFDISNDHIVLYNVNETNQIMEKAKEKTEIAIDKSKINICGVGRLTKVKKFDRLIKIHEMLINNGYNVNTYLLGDGKERETLEKYVQKHNLNHSFKFLGYQENPYKYISKMNLFVCCSTAEGFNTAATESLILGVPVVTTLVSGMEEMLGYNNEYGIVTKNDEKSLYQAIVNLLNHPDLLDFYQKKAYLRGNKFSTTQTVQAVERMLLELDRSV